MKYKYNYLIVEGIGCISSTDGEITCQQVSKFEFEYTQHKLNGTISCYGGKYVVEANYNEINPIKENKQ